MEDKTTEIAPTENLVKPEKKTRKKKVAEDTTISVTDKITFQSLVDTMVDSVTRMSATFNKEIDYLNTLIAALTLKLGGKSTINEDMMSAASIAVSQLRILEENNTTKISV